MAANVSGFAAALDAARIPRIVALLQNQCNKQFLRTAEFDKL